MALSVIPSPTDGEKPSLADLVDTHSVNTVKSEWQWPGWIEFHNHSDLNPWYKLKVKKVINASYRIYDMVPGFGEVVKRY